MQVLPILFAALLAVPGLAPPVHEPEASRPGAPQAAGAGDAEGPHLQFAVHNLWRTLRADVELVQEGERVAQRELDLPPGHSTWTFDVPPGAYQVWFKHDSGFSSWAFTSEGCPGAFRVGVRIQGGVSADRLDTGCLARPAAFSALLEEAKAASRVRVDRDERIRVPMPAQGDRGEWRLSTSLVPSEDGGSVIRFQAGETLAADEWGRETRAAVASEVHVGSLGGAWASSGPFFSPEARVENATDLILYRHGERESFAHSRTYPTAGSSGAAWLDARSSVRRELLFEPPAPHAACRHRNGFQGMDLHQGQRLGAADGCPAWTGLDGRWVAGAAMPRDNLSALPLYWLREAPEGVDVHRVWLADGVAYPIQWEWWTQPTAGPVRHRTLILAALQPGDAPYPRQADAPPAAPGSARLAPLDPLRGPALGASRDRFAFPLDVAADAVRADPTLDRAAPLLRDPQAVLAGALFTVRSEPGAPHAVHAWRLVFTAPGHDAVVVTCERAAPPAPVSAASLAAPPRCAEEHDAPLVPEFPRGIDRAPALGRADLPADAASFDLALARWDRLSRERAGEPVTWALYRAWDEDGAPPVVALGVDMPEPVGPMGLGGTAPTDQVDIDLRTGRTLVHVTGATGSTGAAVLLPGVVPAGGFDSRPEDLGAAPSGLPPLVLAGAVASVAGLGILALLVAFGGALKSTIMGLYTRLVRGEVLDSETRARIHRVVSDEPGIHASGILERVGASNGVADYHLGVLVREGFLTCVETKGFRRYFVTGRYSPREMRARAALKEGQSASVYRVVAENPGISLSEAAERVRMSLPNASRTVKRLTEAGLLERRKEGRVVRLHADTTWAQTAAAEPPRLDTT